MARELDAIDLACYHERGQKDKHFDINIASLASQFGYPAILRIARQWLGLGEDDIRLCEVNATETLPFTNHLSSCGVIFLWYSERKKDEEFSAQLSQGILRFWCIKNKVSGILRQLWKQLENCREIDVASSKSLVRLEYILLLPQTVKRLINASKNAVQRP